MTQDNHVRLQLRLPPDLHQEIQGSAARQERSLNSEIVYRLRVAMSLARRFTEQGEAEMWYQLLREQIKESGDDYK